ncbi:site-specific integrase [Catellatospora paridis]|uniref:site-specific integrase n=1 Tax=Catellatospora paridis TaxID=1617086 RepID=UPI0012D3AB54|nr:site-specific integrase [Catellatospora paridis]
MFLRRHGDDALYALWWLGAVTGLRRGELAGLRWTDVDLESSELTVANQRVSVGGEVTDGDPKTEAAARTIALDELTVAVLRVHAQAGWSSTGAGGYVFCWPGGRPLRPDWVTHRFAELVASSGLPPIRLHDLRHDSATIAWPLGSIFRWCSGGWGTPAMRSLPTPTVRSCRSRNVKVRMRRCG